MDIGVMDTGTCTPMNYTFVEIWHGKSPCVSRSPIMCDQDPFIANSTGEYGAYNTPTFNASETWLRGGWYTDENGMVEVTTVYPGYYDGRCPHVHIMVHNDWSQSTNGFVNLVPSTPADLDSPLASALSSLMPVASCTSDKPISTRAGMTRCSKPRPTTRTRTRAPTIAMIPFSKRPSRTDMTRTRRMSGLLPQYQRLTRFRFSLQYLNGNDLSGGLVGYLSTSESRSVARRVL